MQIFSSTLPCRGVCLLNTPVQHFPTLQAHLLLAYISIGAFGLDSAAVVCLTSASLESTDPLNCTLRPTPVLSNSDQNCICVGRQYVYVGFISLLGGVRQTWAKTQVCSVLAV